MTKEEAQIKLEFESEYLELMKLKPQVDVTTVIEEWDEELDKMVNPNRIEIEVRHPFIFDVRLIPKRFMGYKVKSIIVGKPYPNEFFDGIEEGIEIHLYMLEDPEKYISYVKKHIDGIRQQLNSPDMSIAEALDAITGDFEAHKKWYNDLVIGDI